MKKFLLFMAAIALSISFTGCVDEPLGPDEPVNSDPAEITVSPTEITTTLDGGEFQLTVISNASWAIACDQRDIYFSPAVGSGSDVVTVTIPETTTARNFSINFDASKEAVMQGIPYVSKANASVAVYQNANGDTSIATNVAEVRKLLLAMNPTSTAMEVTEQIAAMTLTGVVVGEPNGNMGNNRSIAIQDNSNVAGSGLTIYCTSSVSKDLAIGDIVSMSMSGAKVQLYGALLQVANIAPNAIEVNGSTTIEPIDVTLSNILDYESQYVKLSNVYPASGVAGNVWNSATSAKNVNFMTTDGESFVIRVSGYASFKSEIIPEKMGYICGVAGRYNNDKQLMPQYASDIQLIEDIPVVDIMPVAIADILVGGAGTYKVKNAWVVGFNGNGVILTDASGAYINAYIYQNPYKTIGERMTVEGTVNVRNGALQFNAPTITVLSGTESVTYPNPTLYTGSELENLCNKFTTGAYLAEYASFKGVLEYDGAYYNLIFSDVDGTLYKGSLSKTPDANLGLAELNGKEVVLYGFVTDYSQPYLNIIPVDVTEKVKITIADVLAGENGDYAIEDAWVVATYDRGCLLTDNSGAYILAYSPATTPAVGTIVSISGSVTTYGGLKQFAAGAVVTETGSKSVNYPTAEVMNAAALDAYVSAPVVKYVEYEGTLAISGNYYNINIDGAATAIGSVQYPTADIKEQLNALNGMRIKVTGYLIGVSSGKYTNTMAVAVEEVGGSGGDDPVVPPAPEIPDSENIISLAANLTAGTYVMAGWSTSYTNNGQTFDWTNYPYHFWTGEVSALGSLTSNSDLKTVNGNAKFELDPNMSDQDKAKGYPASITLVAVDGTTDTYYVMVGTKYLYSSEASKNRRLQLGDTPTEWVASDNANGGIQLTSNGVNLGTAGAQYNMIRSYANATTLKYGLVFFKVSETPDNPTVNNSIYGGWHTKSYCGAPSDIDVYMQLDENQTFKLYQRSNSATYVSYSGTYSLNETSGTISGRYSDGSLWANSYYYSINASNELVLINTNNSTEVTIYEPAKMPSISAIKASRSATKSDVKPL